MTISTLQAKKLLDSGCTGFLASIVDPSKVMELTPNDVLVMRDYVSIFLQDLPRLPLDIEIIFSINLVPGTTPILKALYHLGSTKLKELKKQLKNIIEKDFIQLSHSLTGALG